MPLPKDSPQFRSKLERARSQFKKRDSLCELMREMYQMNQNRTSAFLGSSAAKWRSKVNIEYWESSGRPQNAVDIATAVLGGYAPQWKVTIPEGTEDELASRSEKFLAGVFRLNSRRQMADVVRKYIFHTVLEGAAGLRATWLTDIPDPRIVSGVAYYNPKDFPISLDVVRYDKLYPLGKGPNGAPFRELIHVDRRNVLDVIDMWENVEGINLAKLKAIPEDEQATKEGDYAEWWAYADGGVWYALTLDDVVLKPFEEINYPAIPYEISAFKEMDEDKPEFARLPFCFPIMWAVEREEYMRSRILRVVDMLSNMTPYHTGPTPIQVSGTWGSITNFTDSNEQIRFPQWPGNPPDVWRLLDDIVGRESEGTFSSVMFGNVSSRLSGYGLSQLIGQDTLRMETPRSNIELALSGVADLIFQEMQTYSPDTQLCVTTRTRGYTLAAKLSGDETQGLVTDCFIKPKQASDEVRMATVGAQLAGLPKPPVSTYYILENYFGIAQPEDELRRVLKEEALRDPVSRMIAMLEVLNEEGSPYADIVAAQLAEAMKATSEPQAPEGIAGIGAGMPQGVMGNPPMPGVGGNVVEEGGFSPEIARLGGPAE